MQFHESEKLPQKMFRLLLGASFAALLALVPGIQAAEPSVELARESADFKAKSTLVQEQKERALKASQTPYLEALKIADQTATAAGNTSAIRGVAKEREAVVKGGITDGEPHPGDLPKTLVTARKTFQRGLEKIHGDSAKQQKTLDTAYLRVLAALQTKVGNDPATQALIDAEKQRVISGVYGPISDLRTSIDGTRWKGVKGESWHFKNGTLHASDGNFKYETPEADKVRVIWNPASSDTFKLESDGKRLKVFGGHFYLVQ